MYILTNKQIDITRGLSYTITTVVSAWSLTPLQLDLSFNCYIFYALFVYILVVLWLTMSLVKIIILMSGKRKSGKDYVASLLHTK